MATRTWTTVLQEAQASVDRFVSNVSVASAVIAVKEIKATLESFTTSENDIESHGGPYIDQVESHLDDEQIREVWDRLKFDPAIADWKKAYNRYKE